MKKVLLTVPAVLAALALAGCASDSSRTDSGSSSTQSSSSSTATPAPAPAPQPSDSASLPGTKTVYFAFDSSNLDSAGMATVAAWAKYLAANPGTRVRLEGHADERGTREYNIGLGERRANAVQKALQARGVSGSQITVTSYGEERPVDTGHNEAAWAKNRRVEIAR